jgi:hypothetical protein
MRLEVDLALSSCVCVTVIFLETADSAFSNVAGEESWPCVD